MEKKIYLTLTITNLTFETVELKIIYLKRYSMLAFVEETNPDPRTISLCSPRKVKLIGSVQNRTSKPTVD